jgi:hypothetical protein
MKWRLATLFIIFSLFPLILQAQISTLPITERFDLSFLQGKNIEFIPNWFGNEVESDRRIFQFTESGNRMMGIIPTSTFKPDVQVRLNLLAYKNVTVSFRAKSVKNGTGTRASILYMETSLDGGNTWLFKRQIKRFENNNSGFSNYNYILPGGADNRSSVVLRFTADRSEEGDNTAALIVIDDVSFKAGSEDVSRPEVASVSILNTNTIRVNFSEAVGTSATNTDNYTGVPNLTTAVRSGNNQFVTLTFNPAFKIGEYYTLRVANIADLSGNVMAEPFFFDFVYNPTTPDLVITEIMYNPPEEGTDSLEFLELYNNGSTTAILGGLYFADGISFRFPSDSLQPGEYYLLAVNARAAGNQYGKNFREWSSGALNNSGEDLVIMNTNRVIIDSVHYRPEWGGNGDGRSLVLCRPGSDNALGRNWTTATTNSGGQVNGIQVFAHPAEACPPDVLPSVRFQRTGQTVLESAGVITVDLIVANSNAAPSSIQITVNPSSTATSGSDYTSSVSFPHTITFPANSNGQQSLTITVVNDLFREPFEQLFLSLGNPSNAEVGSISTFTLSILDDDGGVPPVCINEIMASNSNTAADEFRENDDWIEIHNTGTDPVSLAGYYITDNKLNPTKYRIPVDEPELSLIPPGGFLIIWADNQPDQGGLHTNFALSASGEFAGIFMPNGFTVVDTITFPAMQTDISYGREEDCGSNWIFFGQPTFSKSNVASSVVINETRRLLAYPNPLKGGILYISEPIHYQLYDLYGRMILSDRQSNQIDMSGLPGGIYMIVTDQQEVLRIVVSH